MKYTQDHVAYVYNTKASQHIKISLKFSRALKGEGMSTLKNKKKKITTDGISLSKQIVQNNFYIHEPVNMQKFAQHLTMEIQ